MADKTVVDESLTNGAEYVNTNDAAEYIRASENEANNPIVTGPDHFDEFLQKQDGETQEAYVERVGNPAVQPVQPAQKYSYLGEEL